MVSCPIEVPGRLVKVTLTLHTLNNRRPRVSSADDITPLLHLLIWVLNEDRMPYHHAGIRFVKVDACGVKVAPLCKSTSNDPACEDSADGTIDSQSGHGPLCLLVVCVGCLVVIRRVRKQVSSGFGRPFVSFERMMRKREDDDFNK